MQKDVTECRPISILCILSKVFEQVILHKLCHFLEVKTHYNKAKSGFRKGPSATTFLLKLRDDIKHAMNTSEVTLGILLYLIIPKHLIQSIAYVNGKTSQVIFF